MKNFSEFRKELNEARIARGYRSGGMPTGDERASDDKPLLIWLDKLERELKKFRKTYANVDSVDAVKLYNRGVIPRQAAKDLLSGKEIKEETLHWEKMGDGEKQELVKGAGLPKRMSKDTWRQLDRRAKEKLGKYINKTTGGEFNLKEGSEEETAEDAPPTNTGGVSGLTPDTVGVKKKKKRKRHNDTHNPILFDMARRNESAGLEEATRVAVDKEFRRVYGTKMDKAYAIKHLEKKFGIKDVKLQKDKNGKIHVISFSESVDLGEGRLEKSIRMLRNGDQKAEFHKEYCGHPVFRVSEQEFGRCKSSRRKGDKWNKYFDGDSPNLESIRKYSLKNPNKPLVIQNEVTGQMSIFRRRLNDGRLMHNKKKKRMMGG
tara:strand:- start:1994 stop:3118 length:1125 start_codon:yes stop_codon:yes gene_type:complete